MRQKLGDFTKFKWDEVERCLSALTRFSVSVYDPREKRPCSPTPVESSFCRLAHQMGKESFCKETLAKEVDLAVQSQEIVFSKCKAQLNYFVAPVRVGNEIDFALVGGKVYFTEEELLSFKREAARSGLSPESVSSANGVPFGTEEELRDAARTLQSVGTTLLENIYYRNQYHSKAALLMTLLNITGQFKKDPSAFDLNMSLLINTLGFLFDLKSACVFHQDAPQKPHKAVAVFGAQKEKLHRTEASLDALLPEEVKGKDFLFTDGALDLLKAKLPEGVHSCHLFPIFESRSSRTTLAVLNSSLTPDDAKMIASFCRQAGAVHENIELQNQLTHEKKMTESLSRFTALLGTSLRTESLYEEILEQVARLLEAEQGSLMILDDEKNELAIKAMKGISKTLMEMLTIKSGEGIAGQVFQSGSPLLVRDIDHDPRASQKTKPRYRTGSFISFPLKLRGRTIGVINLADKADGRPFTEEDLHRLAVMGGHISIALERSELFEKTEELKKISIVDSLTGLFNQRYFEERLVEEMERARRHIIPVSLIMIDIDNFKAFHSAYNAAGGDKLLKLLSRAIRKYVRTVDVASRYGGERFAVILPQTNKAEARMVADRLREGIEKREALQKKYSDFGGVTLSIGVATYPDDARTTEEFIRNAERALYQAILQGKNRAIPFYQDTFLQDPVR